MEQAITEIMVYIQQLIGLLVLTVKLHLFKFMYTYLLISCAYCIQGLQPYIGVFKHLIHFISKLARAALRRRAIDGPFAVM